MDHPSPIQAIYRFLKFVPFCLVLCLSLSSLPVLAVEANSGSQPETPDNSLFGTVVDAEDGTTPVYPVFIDLLDPDTGSALEGYGTDNNPDGSYSIANIPGGDYKIFFNAYDAAQGYRDELHEDIYCDDGSCGFVENGDVITIGQGLHELNVDLELGLTISGRVTDEAGEPFANIPLDVLDSTGTQVGDAAFTNSNGEWSKEVIAPGTFYVRTVGDWTPDHIPEIWNDHACEDCYTNPLSIGDPIEVNENDVPDINFALASRVRPESLNRCEQVRRQFRAYRLAGPDDPKFQAVQNKTIPPSYIADLKALNVNWVAIMQSMYVDDALDSTLAYEPKGGDVNNLNWSFSEEDLEFLIKTFRAHGINVYVTLAINTSMTFESDHPVHRHEMGEQLNPQDPGEPWPWNVDHPDHEAFVAEFWQTYRDRAVELGEILERNGVTLYSMGTETRNLFRTRTAPEDGHPNDYRSQLQQIVDDVRTVYSGLLSYDMHWGEYANPSPAWELLWDDLDLDIIGVSAYIDNLMPGVPTEVVGVPVLEAALDNVFRTQFLPVQEANSGRPILFLEGSFSNSIGAPWESHYNLGGTDTDEDSNGLNDGQETQANLFQALFNLINRYRENIKGVFIWDRFMVSDEAWQNIIADDPGDPRSARRRGGARGIRDVASRGGRAGVRFVFRAVHRRPGRILRSRGHETFETGVRVMGPDPISRFA